MLPNRISPPSARSTAGTHAGISNGAQRGCGSVSISRSSGCTAIWAPVCAATRSLSPMWSQWPCVLTMSLRVHERASSSLRIHSSDGMAVSMAIASRVRSSAITWQFVARTPMTLWIASSGRERGPAGCGLRGLRRELRPDAVERIVDELGGGPLDHPGADAGERSEQLDGRRVGHRGRTVDGSTEAHLTRRLDRGARCGAGRADHGAIRRLDLDELELDREPERHEPDADLGADARMRVVRAVDRLHARTTRREALEVEQQVPDLGAWRIDLDGSGELHRSSL